MRRDIPDQSQEQVFGVQFRISQGEPETEELWCEEKKKLRRKWRHVCEVKDAPHVRGAWNSGEAETSLSLLQERR